MTDQADEALANYRDRPNTAEWLEAHAVGRRIVSATADDYWIVLNLDDGTSIRIDSIPDDAFGGLELQVEATSGDG